MPAPALLLLIVVSLGAGKALGDIPTDYHNRAYPALAMDVSIVCLSILAIITIKRSATRLPTWATGISITPTEYGVTMSCDRCGFTMPFLPNATLTQLFRYGRMHHNHAACKQTS